MLFLLVVGSVPGRAAPYPQEPLAEYRLQISFDLPRGKVLGRATILAPQGHNPSWDDLRKSFESQINQDLSWFFHQWVDGTGQPQIRLDQALLKKDKHGYAVSLILNQEGQVKRLSVPVRFSGPQDSRIFQVDLSRRIGNFTFRLDFQPEKVIIYENYDVFRKLAPTSAGENGDEDLFLILRPATDLQGGSD